MGVRILSARTGQACRLVAVQPVAGRIEASMLPGEDDKRRERARLQRGSDWRELDGFGSSADYKYDGTWQPSP